MARTMPRQKPGESEQDVQTPGEFLAPVQVRFGPIGLDLAANGDNHVCPLWLGPGSPLAGGEDALAPALSWAGTPLRWLNPPFGDIEPWARKCAEERHHAFIALLTPASVGSNWFTAHVHGKALVLALSPRLTFVSHSQSYPKDLILSVFGPLVCPGFDLWRWR